MQNEQAAAREKNILEEAKNIIYGDREKTYGDPARNLKVIADFWETYLNAAKAKRLGYVGSVQERVYISIDDVCQMMILVKQARLINDPSHRDSKVDICGYAALSDRCATPKQEQGYSPSPKPKVVTVNEAVICRYDAIQERFIPVVPTIVNLKG